MASDWKNKVVGAAEFVLGVTFLVKGYKKVAGQPDDLLLGENQVVSLDNESAVLELQNVEVHTVEDRIKAIKDVMYKASLQPLARQLAMGVVNRKCGDRWCIRPKDEDGEIKAIFHSVHDPGSENAVRYVKDHVTTDQYQSPRVTFAWKGADCDCQCVYLGSQLMAIGYPIRLRVVRGLNDSNFSHIYLMVGTPGSNPSKWRPLDPTEDNGPFWEVEGAQKALETGKPAGRIAQTKDFDVFE